MFFKKLKVYLQTSVLLAALSHSGSPDTKLSVPDVHSVQDSERNIIYLFKSMQNSKKDLCLENLLYLYYLLKWFVLLSVSYILFWVIQ